LFLHLDWICILIEENYWFFSPHSYAFSDWHPRADQLSADPQQILILHRVHMAPLVPSNPVAGSSLNSRSVASSELPLSSRASFTRFTSEAVDADTPFDQHAAAALQGSAAALLPLSRLYSDSHAFLNVEGAILLEQDSVEAGMCTLPNLTRFKAVDGDECAPLTVSTSGGGAAAAMTKGSAADTDSDRGRGSVYCYTNQQLETILASVVAQTAERFEMDLGQAGTRAKIDFIKILVCDLRLAIAQICQFIESMQFARILALSTVSK
jgi:hypothetical protein